MVQDFKRLAYRRAFTLIEMLVVIIIIGILASLLYTVVLRTLPRAKHSIARARVAALEMAIKSYRSAYGKWPGQSQGTEDKTYILDNMTVVGALTTNDAQNPRRLPFLQVDPGELTKTNFFSDPWGHPYVIALDCDGNGKTRVYYKDLQVQGDDVGADSQPLRRQIDFTISMAVAVFCWKETLTNVTSSDDGAIIFRSWSP